MSSVPFDPYHKWLGIPRTEQPAHHYRLLGIPVFEEDPQVIEGAADRQMAFLRKFQSGEHAADAMKLLNEISRARLCLLKPDTKSAYDATLKAQLGDGPSDETTAEGGKPVWQQPMVIGGAGVGVLILIVLVMLLRPGTKPVTPAPGSEEKGGKEVVKSSEENSAEEQKGESESDASGSPSGVEKISSKKKTSNQERPLAKGDKAPWPTLIDGDPRDEAANKKSTTGAAKLAAGSQDILSEIDVDRDRIQGTWKISDGKLITPTGSQTTALQLSAELPDEFDLTADITRLSGEGSILLAFPVQGTQSGVALDGWGGSTSGLETIDEEHPDTHPDRFSGQILKSSKTVTVICQIRKGEVSVQADGTRIVNWKGDPEKLGVDPKYRLRPSTGVAIGIRDAQFAISRLELTPRKASGKSPGRSTGDGIDLIARVDVARDSTDGAWKKEDGGLVGQSTGNNSAGRLNLSYHPPPQYELAMMVERTLPRASFAIGLPVQGNLCSVVLDTGARNDTCGLSMIDGKLAHQNETTKRQKVLPGGEAIPLVCRVERNHVTVLSGSKVILNWQGDASRLSAPESTPFVDPLSPMLCVIGNGSFRVTDVILNPLKDSGTTIVSVPVPSAPATERNTESMPPEGSLAVPKLKTPDAATLDAARLKVRNSFKVEYGLAKKAEGRNLEPRISLAKTLYGKALDTEDDSATAYVLLSEAAEYASEAGQLGLAWEILQALGERFDTTPLPLMERAAKAAKPFAKSLEEITVLSAMYAGLIDSAVQADDFETASKASQEALSVSKKITVLKDQLAASGRRVSQLREAFELAKAARDSLASKPDDGPANLAWGRYLCFYKGDWALGLPYLAKGSDAELASLAKRDLDQPRDIELLEKVGDDWWALGEKEKEKDPVKTNIRARAAEAWQLAVPSASRQQATLLNIKIARPFEPTKSFMTTGSGQGVAVSGPDLNPGPMFTVEFWVSTTSSDGVLISKRHQLRESSIVVSMSRGRPIIGGDASSGFKNARSKVAINDGRWHHIAAVKVFNRLGLFVDGKSVAQTTGYDSYISASPWKVGHQDEFSQAEPEARFCRVRFSKDARYLVNFIPEKTYTKDKSTIFVP